jgi:hypothetical protein
MKGMITGLTLDDGLSDLAYKFNVTLEVRKLPFSALIRRLLRFRRVTL